MARKLKHFFTETTTGRILTLLAYVAMALLVLMFLDGNGTFIYEGF